MSPDDPTAVEILRKCRVARIATLSRNQRPHINPLYFVTANGVIHLGTSDRTLAVLNVRANPSVTILFNVERKPRDPRVLRIGGHATVRTDRRVCRDYRLRVARKYFGHWSGIRHMLTHALLIPIMHRYHSSGEKGKECVIEVVPESAELLQRE